MTDRGRGGQELGPGPGVVRQAAGRSGVGPGGRGADVASSHLHRLRLHLTCHRSHYRDLAQENNPQVANVGRTQLSSERVRLLSLA
jgi:hypothetical protein